MKYSIIIPVFNRPDEVDELLESLCLQTVKDFEVLIVEDGSQRDCKAVVDRYADRLDVKYFMKPNSGPGQSRNYGAERANGEWLIILDSDVVLPKGYLEAVDNSLTSHLYSCLRWSRRCPPLVHPCSEGHQLFHDLLLHHWRYPRRQGKT